ncbi:MAG TPA: nitrilase-related carbon-nitrogen hydrolase [Gemmatimonadaceae bacterium]|nr:nitrilase-related carbon-nitrogen hydrolase [Gemmatimonadaceae bacterium]
MVFARNALAVAVTAILIWFGTGLHPWWPLMWFAPLPLLLVATRSTWKTTAIVAFLGIFIGYFNIWHYLHDLLSTPAPAFVLILGINALAFALVTLLFRALYNRQAWRTALIAVPAAWVSVEYINSLTSAHGTAGSFAYSQLDFLPILQVASLTGPWGISALLLLFSSAIVILPRAPRVGATGLGLIALALAFGVARLATPTPGSRITVGLVASDLRGNRDVANEGAQTTRLLNDYATAAQRVAAQGAHVIVLPEKLAVVVDADTVSTDSIFQRLADKDTAQIVVGVIRVASRVKYNQARIYRPGAAVGTYDKQHMLPPYESKLTPGTTLTLLSEPTGTWGVAICKDMDFTRLSRQYGAADIGVLLVPAWDFDLDRFLHGHMAVMRGVEDGFTIARAAKQGYLTVSDDRGRILAEARSDAAPFSTLVADLSVTPDTTLYRRFGDWFAWLMLATLVSLLVRRVFVQ